MKKTVVITGAAGQIGKAIAQTFALNDFRVVAVDVNPLSEMLLDLPNQNLQHMGITEHSICTMDGVRDVFRDIPTDSDLRVLVNNAAGNAGSYSPNDTLEERWDKTMDNDLNTYF